MKPAKFYLAIMILWVLPASAQLEVYETSQWTIIGELKFALSTKAKMQYSASGKDTTYMLLMRDAEKNRTNHYFSVSFNSYGDTYNQFYEILKSFFIPENRKNRKYMKTFKLGGTGVNVQHDWNLSGATIMLTTREGFIVLNEREIDKLFGRREE